jgi:hypothetical protein
MPRVKTKTKSARGKAYTCCKCGQAITAGEQYHSWSFRYGGTYRQHAAHGRPTRGQLTQSKLAAVYDAQDAASETIAGASDADDIAQALRDVAEQAREVAEEYREAVRAMNMEGSGNENEERADALGSYADTLESAADEMDGEQFEPADEQEEDVEEGQELNDDGETEDEWLDVLRDRATDALAECDV